MKTALVLGGGGSKGAYEIGVWRALQELQIKVDIVTGTSIGAMIGVMVVQGQYEECCELWKSLKVDDVIANGVNLDFDLELLMSQKDRYKTIMQTYVTHKGADISPFVKLLHRMFDKQRFFSSPIDYACMSVNISKRKPQSFDKDDMKYMDPCDAILASASCFPAFPLMKIGEDYFIDGGYHDNVPIALARSKGADVIIAVDLKSVGTLKVKDPQSDVVYIEPLVPLGSFLLFDHDVILRNMELGYQDAMKKLGKYDGYVYTFEKDTNEFDYFEVSFQRYCESFAFPIKQPQCSQMYHSILKDHLSNTLKDVGEYAYPALRILEMCALLFDLDDIGIYTFHDFIALLKDTIKNDCANYDAFYDQAYTLEQMKDTLKEFSQKDVVFYFYHRLFLSPQKTSNITITKGLALLFSEAFMLAVMIFFIEGIYKKIA